MYTFERGRQKGPVTVPIFEDSLVEGSGGAVKRVGTLTIITAHFLMD